MKKVYILMLMMLAVSYSFAQISVTFQVDMSKQTVGANGVHVAGNFQSEAGFASDWDPSTSALTDGDGDGVYTLTVSLPSDSTYSYKFVNGNAWGSDEGVPSACNKGGNRELVVPSSGSYSVPKVCYGSCEACPTAVDTIAYTIKVDMSQQTVSANGVHLAGNLQKAAGYASDWDPSSIALTDANSDKVYEITLKLPEGVYSFKYVNGNAWGSDEGVPGACAAGGNREVKLVGDGDNVSESGFTASYIALYGSCPPKDSVDVTFMVDMNNQTVGANGVHMAGAFGQAGLPDWNPGGIKLSDANTDGIYEVKVRLPEGSYPYKFVNGNAWGGDEAVAPACNVNGNRLYVAASDGDAFSDILTANAKYCFGECAATCPAILPPVNVTFRVDMSDEIVSSKGVFVAGTFPGAGWVKDTFELKDDNGDEIFEYTFVKLPVDDYLFKFYNGDCGDDGCNEDHDFKTDGCGVASGTGGFNRYIDFQGLTKDTVVVAFVYNSCETSTLSIANNLSNKFVVYPNPTQGKVTIDFKHEANNYQIQMSDLNGRNVLNAMATSKSVSLNIENLKSGIYLLMVSDDKGGVAYEKLIVQ